MNAQRPVVKEHVLEPEPERILLPTLGTSVDPEEYQQTVVTPRNSLPKQTVRQRRPIEAQRTRIMLPPITPSTQKPRPVGRAIPIILTISCICFLLAGSILAFALMGRPSSVATAVLTATPNILRADDTFTLAGNGFGAHDLMTFTYDTNVIILDVDRHPLQAHTDAQGAFSIQIAVPHDLQPGAHSIHAIDEAKKLSVSTTIAIQVAPASAPHFQVAPSQIDLGGEAPGVVTDKTVTLINAGGGQISWQQSSDQSWLAASPNSGTFSGRGTIHVTVNRGDLKPQSYTGHITFTQRGEPGVAMVLTVTMVVKPAPASLTITPASLVYSASSAQDPKDQTVVLQNSGDQTMEWSGGVTTGDGASWLSVSPSQGEVAPNASAVVVVHVQSRQLAVGNYQGSINFTGGAQGKVNVALSVVTAGNLVVSPPALTFNAVSGQQAVSKSLNLQNSGGQALNWTVSATTVDQGQWLSVTPTGGTLDSGAQANVTVNANGAELKPGSYQGTLNFVVGGSIKTLAISFTVAAPPVPVIAVQPTSLNFTTVKGQNPAGQDVTLTNTGNATLNWNTTLDNGGSDWLKITPATGSLAATQSVTLSVEPQVADAQEGTLTTTITLADSTPNSKVKSQQIAVTVVIQTQAAIDLSSDTLSFTNSGAQSSTSKLLTISNSGSANLNWSIAQPSESAMAWISIDPNEGTIVPGGTTALNVVCTSGDLTPGTYNTTLIVSDSDDGTRVAQQTVQISLVVD